MSSITQSSDIKSLFGELLVTKESLNRIKSHYTGIKNDIILDLQELYDDIDSKISWVNANLSSINENQTRVNDRTNLFTQYTDNDINVVKHSKHLEMMNLYNSYIKNFYKRLTELEQLYNESFLKDGMANLSSFWKFNYSDTQSDGTNISHIYGSLNINEETDIIEISNNRYLYISNENQICDVDYKNKECFIVVADNKIIMNNFIENSGSDKNNIVSDPKILKIFQKQNDTNVYCLIDIGYTSKNVSEYGQVVGQENDGLTHIIMVAKYDKDRKILIILNEKSNTSYLVIKDKLLENYKIEILDKTYDDYVYFYISSYLCRIKINGVSSLDILQRIILRSSIDIFGSTIHEKYIIVPVSDKIISIYDLTTNITIENPIRSLNTMSLAQQFVSGEQGTLHSIFNTSVGIYFATDKSLWLTTDLFVNCFTQSRIHSMSILDLSLKDKKIYTVDDYGTFYYLYNKKFICSSKIDNSVIMSPTRYADRLFFIKSNTVSNTEGYAYNRNVNLLSSTSIIQSFSINGVYCVIDEKGLVGRCDISSGIWKPTKLSIVSNKTITTSLISDDMIYITTSDSVLYSITKESIYSDSNIQANIVVSASVGSIFTLYKHKDLLYLGGYGGRISVYDLSKNILIPYDSETFDYCVESGSALGNQNVRCITSDSINLIVMGNTGKVSSCNMTSKKWTRYDGSPVNSTEIDSPIYNNGSASGDKDIICCINYMNTILFIFCSDGRIASCYLTSGYWTNFDGVNSGNLPGPNIFNNGSVINYATIRTAILMNGSILFASDNGYMASLNPITKGFTSHVGSETDINNLGPGHNFDGSGFNLRTIRNMYLDTILGLVFLSGQESYVSTYSINEKEVLSPLIVKLYYSGRSINNNDYLSSLFINVSIETLAEVKTFYPPRQNIDFYEGSFDSSYYTYRNGKYIISISSDLKSIIRSDDNGVSFISHNISNLDWIPSLETAVLENRTGYVDKVGNLGFYLKCNGKSYFLLSNIEAGLFNARWYTLHNEEEVLEFNKVSSKTKDVFYTKVMEGNTKKIKFIKHIDNFTISLIDIIDMSEYSLLNTEVSMIYDKDFLKISCENGLHSKIIVLDDFSFYPKISSVIAPTNLYIDNNLNKDLLFFNRYFSIRNKTEFLSENGGQYLGYFGSNSIVDNFIFSSTSGDILIISVVSTNESTKDTTIDSTFINTDSVYITETIINASQYISDYSYNKYKDFSVCNLGKINIKPSYIKTTDDGKDGFLGIDINYYSNYIDGFDNLKANLTKKHVIISLKSDMYGREFIPYFRVFKSLYNRAKDVCYDSTNNELVIASYSKVDENNIIRITDSIHIFKGQKTIYNTPIRALTDSWYSARIRMSNSINSFMIRCKLRSLVRDTLLDTNEYQFTIRYEVLISSIKTGKFILYEVEKSPIMCRTDIETKVIEPYFKIKAIDGFDDELIELYSSILSGRQTTFNKVFSSDYTNEVIPLTDMSYDFMTFFQLGENNNNFDSPINYNDYDIKIRQLSTLPSNVDVQFYIEPYKMGNSKNINERTEPIKDVINNIERSEYKNIISNKDFDLEYIFGVPGIKGFLNKTLIDITDMTNNLHTFNHEQLPQIDAVPIKKEVGFSDTYMIYLKGLSKGLFNKITGIVSHQGKGIWKIVPYSVNKKTLDYKFDESASKAISLNFDTRFITAGRNVHKMRMFGIFGKNVINNADYYSNYSNIPGIVRSEGIISNNFGLFEGVSTLDNFQKRYNKTIEVVENGIYRKIKNGYDSIRNIPYGLGYDYIDRYSLFELPFYHIRAWWIPAKGYITRGNESLLTFDSDESESSYKNLGRHILPFDSISAPSIIDNALDDDEGGGVGSSGKIFDPNKVAFSTLIAEKYPLEHWDGFNDLDFVKKWKDTYIDKAVRIRYVVEKPKNPSGNSTFITYDDDPPEIITSTEPTNFRTLYYYDDNFDWERRGRQTFKYLTKYEYDSYNWIIYLHELITRDKAIPSQYSAIDETIKEDRNLSTYGEYVVNYNNIGLHKPTGWYVQSGNNHDDNDYDTINYPHIYIETSLVAPISGGGSFPRLPKEKIGKFVETVFSPIVDAVIKVNSGANYNSRIDNSLILSTSFMKIYYRQKLMSEISKDGSTDGFILGKIPNNILVAPSILPYSNTNASPSSLISAINGLDNNTFVSLVSFGTTYKLASMVTPFSSLGGGAITAHNTRKANLLFGKKGQASLSQYEFSGYVNDARNVKNPSTRFGYDNDIGLIFPIKFSKGKYVTSGLDNTASIISNFQVTVRTLYGDCSDLEETIAPNAVTLFSPNPYFDDYVGGDYRQWLGAYRYTVRVNLLTTPNSSKYIEKTYYRYVYNKTDNPSSRLIAHSDKLVTMPSYWDTRVPSSLGKSEIIDSILNSVTEPIASRKTKIYNETILYHNGVCSDVQNSVPYQYKWIRILPNAVIVPSTFDESGKNTYTITCEEHYQWGDGTKLVIPTTKTLLDLLNNWNVVSTLSISVNNDNTKYIKTYSIVFVGNSLISDVYKGTNETITITRTDDVLYSATKTTVGAGGTRTVKWISPTGL